MLYPMLLQRHDITDQDAIPIYIVLIAESIDYTAYESRWMDDPRFPDGATWIPDVDMLARDDCYFEFQSEREAFLFIQKWWATHKV